MNSISVILNVYKRPHMLDRQIEAVLAQSVYVKAEDIHVWYNTSGFEQFPPNNKNIKTYACNWNTKFFGRFTLPLLCRTNYVAVFDDDVIPQKNWFMNCLDTISNSDTDGILGGSGVIIGDMKRKPFKHGWNGNHNMNAERVDYVGQAWFFRQEVSKYMWYERPFTWDNAEDVMFSYLAQKHGGINTFVPPHPDNYKDMWCTDKGTSMSVGRDVNASWRKAGHTSTRSLVYRHCIDNGWKTI